jgi:hypothetical protein
MMGCPVCGELWEHDPECPETEDIRVIEALAVGDLTEALAKKAEELGMELKKGET